MKIVVRSALACVYVSLAFIGNFCIFAGVNKKIMKYIEFRLPYYVADDALLFLRYRLDSDDTNSLFTIPLRRLSREEWGGSLELDDADDILHYGYEYVRGGKVVRNEWNYLPRSLRMNSVNDRYVQCDRWIDSPPGYYTQTALFRMFGENLHTSATADVNWYNRSVTLSLYVMGMKTGETLLVSGDAAVLGVWNPDDALPMSCIAPNLWSVTFDARNLQGNSVQFKIITRSADGIVRWEEGDNRYLVLPDAEPSTAYSFRLETLTLAPPSMRLAGTVIPLFSIRTTRSWGIGDFGDLKAMVDWLAHTGQSVLQLLPVNDTTVCGGEEDSYPYNSVSVFALNPIYADIESLPRLNSEKRNSYFSAERQRLNALETVDYAAVYALKTAYLREYFVENEADIISDSRYTEFIKEQQRWLRPYAMFRFLASRLHCNASEWGAYSHYHEALYEQLLAEYSDAGKEIHFHSFVQYMLYEQLSAAHRYANSKHVALKGDIPIGVAPNGVDVWCDCTQFNLGVSAGAPPDDFSATGQNWGFPTYNWQLMATDGYDWWRRRLQYMSNFFDAYRIDHILGFFRIWQIPRWAVSGLVGSFSPSLPFTSGDIISAGFPFDADTHTRAYISKNTVYEQFGDVADYVLQRYFTVYDGEILTFKDEFRNPLHLRADLYSADSPIDYILKEVMLNLLGEVLFFAADDSDDAYTPRIMASDTVAYSLLNENEKAAYNRLYEDYFYHRHTNFWFEEGMRKLMPVISSTPMTACGEDLGMIPDCVPWVMKNMQIMSLEIQRMPKLFGQPFAHPADYPYLSVATPSTHDMSTLRGWWREDEEKTHSFYNIELGHPGSVPESMSGDIATQIISAHLHSPSLLALFAWQDLMAMDERLRRDNPDDERINIPSNRNHVWCYRMHITVEQLMQERAFNDTLRAMVAASGRMQE